MEIKLINNDSKNLIVFLTGWGCDAEQYGFMKVSENYDVLLCYDYSDLEFEFDFSKYENINLIAFSAGVCVAGLIKDKLPKLKRKIAINGNPLAYNEYFGLRKEIIDVFEGVSKENAIDFRRKFLVNDDNELKLFNANQSHRSFESCLAELESLKGYDNESIEPMKYDTAIISLNDKIFFPERQKEFWEKMCRCIYLKNSAHFPFLKLNDFDKIIEM